MPSSTRRPLGEVSLVRHRKRPFRAPSGAVRAGAGWRWLRWLVGGLPAGHEPLCVDYRRVGAVAVSRSPRAYRLAIAALIAPKPRRTWPRPRFTSIQNSRSLTGASSVVRDRLIGRDVVFRFGATIVILGSRGDHFPHLLSTSARIIRV